MSRGMDAWIFPGQGAQYPGMGRDFYESFAVARELFEAADDILGRHLSHVIFQGPREVLTETRNSQVAIYVVSMAISRVVSEQFPEVSPCSCAGLSLGEYSALTLSGRLSFEECLPLVQCRADAMNAACEATVGTMAAIIGLESQQVLRLVAELALPNDLWVANLNCPGQVVLSGTLRGVQAGIEAARKCGAKRALPLQVHGAFHSGLMQSAEKRVREYLVTLALGESKIGLAMNATGEFEWEEGRIREELCRQVTQPVLWEKCVRTLVSGGAHCLLELGPGKTLAGLSKRMQLPVPTLSIERLEDLDTYSRRLDGRAIGV